MKTAYLHGKVYTVGDAKPWAEALLVEDGTIVAVGSDEEILAAADDQTETVDLDGHMVMPGIHDAHLHLLFSGLKFRYEARLRPAATREEIVEDLRNCQCHGPVDGDGNEWIIGGEFLPQAFGSDGVDNRFLDEAFPDNPVFLFDYSIHHGLANTRALELAGLGSQEQATNSEGILRNEATGRPTGELVEQARWPVMRAVPPYTENISAEAVAWAVSMCHKHGITSVQEASAGPRTLQAFSDLDQDGRLKLHIAAHLVWREEGFGGASIAELDRTIENRESWRSKHVDTGFIKIWLDGAPLPPHMTEAGLTPENEIEESKILIPRDELAQALLRFDSAGLRVKIHCAGEGAIRAALDAIEYVRQHNGPDGPAHELAHAGFISEQDYDRLPQLNATAEMSPAIWHIPEYGLQDGFRFKTVLSHGASMTVGSDWIITESPNLFPGLPGMLEHGSEAVGLNEAIKALTISGARSVGREDRQGSLVPGKSADFIVLDRNLFEVPINEIGKTKVLRTVFEGETVHTA
ncbi:MAG: amidohydrolase [Sinomonas sp.]|nr:amidohydrolase [Sinomonas sp.]